MNSFKRFLLLSVLALAFACSPRQEDQNLVVTEQVKARLDSTLKTLVDSGRIAGISALIFEKNKEVYFNAFGFADREAHKAMDRNTRVRIYSMTKPITGVALMKLYEQGLFQLDDPISKYAPEFTNMNVVTGADANGNPVLVPANRPITIRDLTRHTAGFARAEHPVVGKLVTEGDVMNTNNTLVQMANKLATLPLAFHPGEEWSYGICVDVQAYLVERISGKPFDQFVKENITGPLAMSSTKYVPEDMGLLAAMYVRQQDGTLNRMADSLANSFNGKTWPLKPGGYGLTSNIDDYMRFARMLVNEGTLENTTILKPETVRLMATNHLADSVTERMWLPSKGQVGFGIDFAVRLKPPVNEEEHAGIVGEFFWDGAASTLFWVDPQNELAAVLFVQIFPFDNTVHNAFRRAVYGPFKNQNPSM
ncbi:MAG: class A beta-lactamase-related serine hydrolase [Bacteroidetes bacterium CHB5]|nr:class A beta-lactamase-related serine hydrolase [Bacteroidetes bacterium CHB5]